jgi:hypothetical protein
MIQHEDFWDTIAKNVSIHRSDIRMMKSRSIVLQNGTNIPSEVLFCGTGWSQHYPFLSEEQAVEFGLPHGYDAELGTAKESQKWQSLLKEADEKVVKQFPQLADPPPFFKKLTKTTTSKLFNCIAPLNDDSIVFVGHIQLSNSFRPAEAQAIWTTAFFDKNVQLPDTEQAEREVAYMNAFSRRRYPSHGAAGTYFHFDLVGYTDRLMSEIGLKSHRKGSWWSDLTYPCLASDFKEIKEEYCTKYGC